MSYKQSMLIKKTKQKNTSFCEWFLFSNV